jgi:hypothetical protein
MCFLTSSGCTDTNAKELDLPKVAQSIYLCLRPNRTKACQTIAAEIPKIDEYTMKTECLFGWKAVRFWLLPHFWEVCFHTFIILNLFAIVNLLVRAISYLLSFP